MTDARPSARRGPKRLLSLTLQLGVTGLVTWFILSRVGVSLRDVETLDAQWWTPSLGRLGLASAVLALGYAMSALLWAVMVRDLGGRRIPAPRAIALFLTANLGRYIPGKVWQILGLTYLSRSEGVRARVAGAAAVLGQLFALGGAALVGSAALSQGSPWHRAVAGVSAAIVAALCLGFFIPPIRRRALLAVERWGRTELDRTRIGAGFGVRWALVYLVNWVIYAGAFWLFVTSYEPSVTFLETGPAFAAAYLLGYVVLPAPAGIGVREGALTALLAPVLGVSGALAVAVTSRLWLTVVEVVPAALCAGPTLRRAQVSPHLTGADGESPQNADAS